MSATTWDGPGCVIFMVDESAAMDSPVQDDSQLALGQQAKAKGDAVATALNALLKQLTTAGPDFEVALVGYRTDASGEAVAASRWDGPFTGRDFVKLSELAQHPLAVEQRVRRLPDPGSFTGFREEPVEFLVWYVSQRGGTAPMVQAFQHCRQLLSSWQATATPQAGTPLVVNIFGGGSSDGNPLKAIEEIRQLPPADGPPLVFHVHLASSKLVQATLYSSNRMFLPVGPMRNVFDRSSPLSESHISALKESKTPVSPKARGMICNARMPDVAKFLSLVKAHTKNWPARAESIGGTAPLAAAAAAPVAVPSAAPAAAAIPVPDDIEPVELTDVPLLVSDDLVEPTADGGLEKAALVVALLDRSLADPYAGDTQNAFSRLREHANDLLAKISKTATGMVDVAVVSYGQDATGEVEVRTTFEGALSGRAIVRDTELAGGALRIDEIETQVPNGVGGLMTIPLKKAIFIELDPTTSASPDSAFQAVRGLLDEWTGQHPTSCVPPVVVHLTRGCHAPVDMNTAMAHFAGVAGPAGNVVLYHLVATEDPHPSKFYLDKCGDLQTAELQHLWELTSSLLGREALAESKPSLVKPDSRGFVINGKFDLLLDGISAALA